MTAMSDMLRKDRPLNVYDKLTKKCEVTSGPSNRKQVHDKNYNDKKKQRIQDLGHSVSRENIADHINEIVKILAGDKDTIVRSIIREKEKAPDLLQADMMAVVMEKTKESPIFIGPIYIHNSDFDIFSNFFNHLRVKLIDADTEQLFFGTDEEPGLVKSMKTAFPESGNILCIRHLKGNIKQRMIDDGIDKKYRESVLDSIFGDQGLVHSDDDIWFDVNRFRNEQRNCQLHSTDISPIV
ncbi:Hypothetical predicted protein [Mytilus galloprovincialis]|uniref:MULE transposase domain-containing protein n=1 Tax=Mytilus galloprovincialis TaxID=29158 RepID=A0A8B6DXP7_MYTGA|nr:Hypothetical predicted protein [Mytilus galloprovincialis]